MLEYNRIHISEGIDGNKTKESRKCIICDYYYFFGTHFRFQLKVCIGCHETMHKTVNLNDAIAFEGNE